MQPGLSDTDQALKVTWFDRNVVESVGRSALMNKAVQAFGADPMKRDIFTFRTLARVSIVIYVLTGLLPFGEFEKLCITSWDEPVRASGLWSGDASNSSDKTDLFGIQLFLFGWSGLLVPAIGSFGWLVNPLYFFAYATRRKAGIDNARLLLKFCLLLALLSPWLTTLGPVPLDAASACYTAVITPKIGYYVWLIAILVMIESLRRESRSSQGVDAAI